MDTADMIEFEEMNNDLSNIDVAFSEVRFPDHTQKNVNLTALDPLSDTIPPLAYGLSSIVGTAWFVITIVLMNTTQKASYPGGLDAFGTWSGVGYII